MDNGPYRPYEGAENEKFIKELKEGYVPQEIQEKYRGSEKPVDVALEDKREEDYVPPPPPKYVAYSGDGHGLGGGTQGTGLGVNTSAGDKPKVRTGRNALLRTLLIR